MAKIKCQKDEVGYVFI